jgi:HicB-like protein involved in pilus formation
MAIETKANDVLGQAKTFAATARSWADFSARIFDQRSGLVATIFPTEIERQAFYDSPQYNEINALQVQLMKRFGLAEGATPREKSGRVLVRLPKTLHQCLEIQAKREGVSLNQLAVSKLSLPHREMMDISGDHIADAFNVTHDGFSQDWVIVEPVCNARFLAKCREFGSSRSDYSLNHSLMNFRKNSKNKGKLNRTTKRSGFNDYEDYAYAAEIAVRILQRTDGVTLDHILCDPDLRRRFDETALRLAPPGVIPLKLRCAALNLRKTHRLQSLEPGVVDYDLVSAGPFRKVNLDTIADVPGGYVLYDQKRPVFAGETENLRRRIQLHLSGKLPDFLDAFDSDDLILKLQVLPSTKSKDRLDWLGAFINRERPLLNYQKTA